MWKYFIQKINRKKRNEFNFYFNPFSAQSFWWNWNVFSEFFRSFLHLFRRQHIPVIGDRDSVESNRWNKLFECLSFYSSEQNNWFLSSFSCCVPSIGKKYFRYKTGTTAKRVIAPRSILDYTVDIKRLKESLIRSVSSGSGRVFRLCFILFNIMLISYQSLIPDPFAIKIGDPFAIKIGDPIGNQSLVMGCRRSWRLTQSIAANVASIKHKY